jgi:hypothetical protein
VSSDIDLQKEEERRRKANNTGWVVRLNSPTYAYRSQHVVANCNPVATPIIIRLQYADIANPRMQPFTAREASGTYLVVNTVEVENA